MKMDKLKLGTCAVAITALISGCATAPTSDAQECAGRGVASVFCQPDVRNENDRLANEVAQTRSEISGMNAVVEEQRKEEEALQKRVDALKKQLSSEQAQLSKMKADLLNLKNANKLDDKKYDSLINQLASVEASLVEFQSASANEYDEAKIGEVEDFLTIEVSNVKKSVNEVLLG